LEYIYNGFTIGRETANQALVRSLIHGSIMIFFISGNLSKLDPVKGYWQKIRLNQGFPAIK
jgi:hypothetical protein